MYSSITTGAMHGIDSYLIKVETDISDGLPSFNMVGFMSGEVREAGERVRVALKNLGIHLPARRITVNLSPAGIQKRGIVVDLPVCVGLLICLGYIEPESADGVLVAGEVGLNGEIRPVKGILSIVMEAREKGISTCLVPRENQAEGALVHGIRVVGVNSMFEIVNYLRKNSEERDLYLPPSELDAAQILADCGARREGVVPGSNSSAECDARRAGVVSGSYSSSQTPDGSDVQDISGGHDRSETQAVHVAPGGHDQPEVQIIQAVPGGHDRSEEQNAPAMQGGHGLFPPRRVPDLASVHGQQQAKKALEIAAAGFHNILMTGPPGSGKSMLARCIPGILPPLTPDEALEITRIYSASGMLPADTPLITERPYIAPHHSVTRAALIGGGNVPSAGLISLAHLGVLFLDELAEYAAADLNLLREPLESHEITIRRLHGTYRYPARVMLAAAANPCPCGFYPDMNKCLCTPFQVRNYQKKISGPLIDRIDFRIHVDRVKAEDLQQTYREERSEEVRARVIEAAGRQARRFAGTSYRYNADMEADAVERFCPLDTRLAAKMRMVYEQLGMSARSYHKTLKMARTIADLEGREQILERDLMMAVGFRVSESRDDEDYGAGTRASGRRASGREFRKDVKIVPRAKNRW